MAPPRRFPRQSPIRARRKTAWGIGPQQDLASLTSAAPTKTLWTNGVTLVLESEVTIVRIRGQVNLQLMLATNSGDGFTGALGLGIVNSQAFAAGAASIPGPHSQPEWEGWMWHQFFHMRGVAAQAQGADVSRNVTADRVIEVDTKAMRKFSDNQILFGMIELVDETGTANITTVADTRVLFKLP